MDHKARSSGAGIAAVALLIAGACTSSSSTQTQVQPSPKAALHTFAGGCSGTVLTDAEPPIWAQGGWTNPKGQPWWVPWAFGTDHTTLAYVFASQLVAGTSPRVDGTNNKVLWEAKDHPAGDGLMVEGRPLGQSQPVVTIAGGPSIVDVPTAGCWTFRLSWTANGGQHTSTINLEVLPHETLPAKPA
jgi:hypothetical protein